MAAQKAGKLVFHESVAAVEAAVMLHVSDPARKAELLLRCIEVDQIVGAAIAARKGAERPALPSLEPDSAAPNTAAF